MSRNKRRKKPGEPGPNLANRRKKSYAQEREHLFRSGLRTCRYCGVKLTLDRNKPNSLSLDHYVPLSKGGMNKRKNYVASCEPCNSAKGSDLPHEFMARRHHIKTPTTASSLPPQS